MPEDTGQSGLCCIYTVPYMRNAPWTCPVCGLIHAHKLLIPEPANDRIGWEAWALGEEIAALHCVLRGRKRRKWRELLLDAIVDDTASSAPTTTASLDEIIKSVWIEPLVRGASC